MQVSTRSEAAGAARPRRVPRVPARDRLALLRARPKLAIPVEVALKTVTGLGAFLALEFAKGTGIRKLARTVRSKYGAVIAPAALRKHRNDVWRPAEERIKGETEHMEALLRMQQTYGEDAVARAFLSNILVQADKDGVEMTPRDAMLAQARYIQLDIERKKAECELEKARAVTAKVALDREKLELRRRQVEPDRKPLRRSRLGRTPEEQQRSIVGSMKRAMGIRGKLQPRVERNQASLSGSAPSSAAKPSEADGSNGRHLVKPLTRVGNA